MRADSPKPEFFPRFVESEALDTAGRRRGREPLLASDVQGGLGRCGDAPEQTLATDPEPPFRFAGAGRVQASWFLTAIAPIASMLGAFTFAFLPRCRAQRGLRCSWRGLHRAHRRWHKSSAKPWGASYAKSRAGQVIWQDNENVYVLVNTDVLSIARHDIAEVRYGGARSAAGRCATQEGLFAEPGQIVVANTPVNVPVTVTVEGSSPESSPGTETNIQFYSSLFLDGDSVTLIDGEPGYRYVVLPMSWNDVKVGVPADNDGAYKKIYELYLEDRATVPLGIDPAADTGLRTLVRPIYDALRASTAAVARSGWMSGGYASDKRFEPGNSEANFLLGEGRRAAVLKVMGFDAHATELTPPGAGPGKALPRWISRRDSRGMGQI